MKIAQTLLILLVVLFQPFSGFAKERTGPVPGRYIIKLKAGIKSDGIKKSLATSESIEQLMNPASLTAKAQVFENYYVFKSLDTTVTIADIVAAVGQDKIEYIEPDYFLEFFAQPTDSYFSDQWYLYNEGQEYLGIVRNDGYDNDELVLKSGTPGDDIKLNNYYADQPPEEKSIIVAIVDSGVDMDHPELSGQFWVNEDEVPDNGVDDDHNGYIDDINGFDLSGDILSFLDPQPDNDPTDQNGHGTHLAGLVAAKWNSYGIAGVAPNAKIMALKIRPNALTSISSQAIIYAVDAGANIINLSWGSPFESGLLREALAYARTNNVLVCIAAGNSGDTTRYYPAAFDSSFVVAASNSDGYLTYFTTYGSHIDIAAPGQDILSLRAAGTDLYYEDEPGLRIISPDSNLLLADGTSMSSPIVAGAAALLWSYHPEMNVQQIEQLLLMGADDLIDPFNSGDTLIGPDSISGYGTLNIDQSFALMNNGGVFLSYPINRQRYFGAIELRATAIGGYNYYWKLEFSLDNQNWEVLNEGNSLPSDSVLFVFDRPDLNGIITFRLSDSNGQEQSTIITYVSSDRLDIVSPQVNETLKYSVDIFGSVFGNNYDSLIIKYMNGLNTIRIAGFTKEYFNELIMNWPLSGMTAGNYNILIEGYFKTGKVSDTINVIVESSFAAGWPRRLGSYGSITPIVTDLNHDSQKEIVIGCVNGLYLFNPDGSLVDGFPILTDKDMRTIPITYDIDHDTDDELIFTNIDGVHVVNYNGTATEGWPVYTLTGLKSLGYGSPYTTVGKLGLYEDSAILFVNQLGEISAFEFNGDSYFYSMDGYFGSFTTRLFGNFSSGKSTPPQVTTADINKDGLSEVIASFAGSTFNSGIGIFDGRTGQPAFGYDNPTRMALASVLGFALADMNNDSYLNIIALGNDTNNITTLNVVNYLGEQLNGWPKYLPDVSNWIGNYPVVANLDQNGSMEIICTFFEFDIGYVYIFNSDGSAYAQLAGYPEGVAFVVNATLGTPAVANLVGDEYPEIVFRTGHILPGTGSEDIYILDHIAQVIPGWPIATPAQPFDVVSSRFAPLIDDIDGDDLVEMVLVSDNTDLLVWDFEAPYNNGRNKSRLFGDNLNTNIFTPYQIPTDVNDPASDLPDKFTLSQNYPNPFNPATIIEFALPQKEAVKLEIFNILGQKVTTLIDDELDAGYHKVAFNGSNYATGLYLYRLEAGVNSITKKMVLVK